MTTTAAGAVITTTVVAAVAMATVLTPRGVLYCLKVTFQQF